jgi:hypothetical protein
VITADELAAAQRRYCERMVEAGRAYRQLAEPARVRFDKAVEETRAAAMKLMLASDVAAYLSAMHRAEAAFERIAGPAREEIDAVLDEWKGQAHDAAA